MPDFTTITASTPVIVPAQGEQVYDKYWLSSLRIEAGDPNQPIRMMATLSLAKEVTKEINVYDMNGRQVRDANGKAVTETATIKELKPGEQPKRVVVNNLLAIGEANADVKSIVNGVLLAIEGLAVQQGLI